MTSDDGHQLAAHLSVKKAKTASWIVRGFRAHERIGMPMRAEIVVDAARPLDPATLLGDDATLTLSGGEAPERYFHGVVSSATVDAVDPEGCRITLVVVSRLALLELQRNSTMFRETNLKKLTEALLKRVGMNPKHLDWRVTPADRPMFIQRDERDFDFLYRLLAQEGLTFFSQHTEEAETLVFVKDDAAFSALGDAELFLDRAAASTGERTVTAYRERQTARPGATMTRDYDLRAPSQDLSGSAAGEEKGDASREVYFHPATSRDTALVKKRARAMLDQINQDALGGVGASDWPAMELGRWFEISGHPRAQGQFLIEELTHEGGFGVRGLGVEQEHFAYRNDFRTVPKGRPLRLGARTAPTNRPSLGFATGVAGEELHGNEYGQVKVSFTWDRSGISDDRSSDWLRVGQLALGGSMIVPRVGFEVLTDNELDDPDRPVVTGHLYNGVAMPPYALPDGATRSAMQTATTSKGEGANEIRFHDTAGEEEIFINASRDFAFSAEHDALWKVGADETLAVGSDETIKVGANLTVQVQADRSLTVGAQQKIDVGGDVSDGVGGASSVSVGAMRSVTVGGDLVETVASSLSRTVGGLQVVTGIKGFDRTIKGMSENTVGAAWLEACAGSRSSTTETSRVETVGALKSVNAKTIEVKAEAAVVMTEGTETVKVGGDRADSTEGILSLTAGGGLSLKGKSINIVGKKKIIFTIGGTTIEVKPTTVKIKSSKVKLDGVKSLPSASMHKSA